MTNDNAHTTHPQEGSHQMEVSDEMWKWAEEQCSNQEGPASFLLNILIAEMRVTRGGGDE